HYLHVHPLLLLSYSFHLDYITPQSFPTRRSSDLFPAPTSLHHPPRHLPAQRILHQLIRAAPLDQPQLVHLAPRQRYEPRRLRLRSEEHTSELQSRENLVCRLLLEKKKSTKIILRR